MISSNLHIFDYDDNIRCAKKCWGLRWGRRQISKCSGTLRELWGLRFYINICENVHCSVLREWILEVREVKSEMKILFTHFEKWKVKWKSVSLISRMKSEMKMPWDRDREWKVKWKCLEIEIEKWNVQKFLENSRETRLSQVTAAEMKFENQQLTHNIWYYIKCELPAQSYKKLQEYHIMSGSYIVCKC